MGNSQQYSSIEMMRRATQFGIGPSYDTNPLSYERIMKDYTKLGRQTAESKCDRQINATVMALFNRENWAIRSKFISSNN